MSLFRASGFDELGLRRALSDRVLPALVAAMAFLAALAIAGWFGSSALSAHWQNGAAAALTVQVPRPTEPAEHSSQTRLAAVVAILNGTPGVASARALSDEELSALLKPWLGKAADKLAIPIPAVIAVKLNGADVDPQPIGERLEEYAPGTMVEDHGIWVHRLSTLARSLQACAGLALLLVAAVAAAVIAVATRAGLSTRREAIEIVHGLGATDGYIASRFAARATFLAAYGAGIGALGAAPVLVTLARLAAPFVAGTPADTLSDMLAALPLPLWLSLPSLPAAAAIIGFVTAQTTVRRWLQRLP